MVGEETSLRRNVVLANIDYHNMAAIHYEKDYSTHGLFDKGKGSQVRLLNMVDYLYERTSCDMLVDIGYRTGNVRQHSITRFGDVIGVDVSIGMFEIVVMRGLSVMLADGWFAIFR